VAAPIGIITAEMFTVVTESGARVSPADFFAWSEFLAV
jgi:hypothetical protein